MGKYRIIKGKEFRPNGPKSLIVQEQLTDELAEFFIKKNPTILGTVIELIEPKNDDTKKVEETKVETTNTNTSNKKTNFNPFKKKKK